MRNASNNRKKSKICNNIEMRYILRLLNCILSIQIFIQSSNINSVMNFYIAKHVIKNKNNRLRSFEKLKRTAETLSFESAIINFKYINYQQWRDRNDTWKRQSQKFYVDQNIPPIFINKND